MRVIDEQALEDIAAGAVIMGSGGGGDPYIGMLMARQAIREHGPVELLTEGGFATGHAYLDGIGGFTGQQLLLSFQNEFLAARIDRTFCVTVPDMITVLDLESGHRSRRKDFATVTASRSSAFHARRSGVRPPVSGSRDRATSAMRPTSCPSRNGIGAPDQAPRHGGNISHGARLK